jgi:FPC/CPF motif-containing protein YcgG
MISMITQDIHHGPAQRRGSLIEQFRSLVSARGFPCVGAKSALNRDRMEFAVLEDLGSKASTTALLDELSAYSARYPDPGVEPVSLIALFRDAVESEDAFHDKLWAQLQALHDLDAVDHGWAEGVSADPDSSEFSFSVAGRAFFVVGLHPKSSRIARRAPCPALVFNFHDQFEALRSAGRYDKLQAAIRQRDIALQGSINPVLARFGEDSEALQYSGKASGGCPFHARHQ